MAEQEERIRRGRRGGGGDKQGRSRTGEYLERNREKHEERITRKEQDRRKRREEQEGRIYKEGVGMYNIYRGAVRSMRGE
jgi:hypothetical protein